MQIKCFFFLRLQWKWTSENWIIAQSKQVGEGFVQTSWENQKWTKQLQWKWLQLFEGKEKLKKEFRRIRRKERGERKERGRKEGRIPSRFWEAWKLRRKEAASQILFKKEEGKPNSEVAPAANNATTTIDLPWSVTKSFFLSLVLVLIRGWNFFGERTFLKSFGLEVSFFAICSIAET